MNEQPSSDPWGKFIFVAEHGNGQRVSVEIRGDSDLSDTVDAIETFLVAAGFDRAQVLEVLK